MDTKCKTILDPVKTYLEIGWSQLSRLYASSRNTFPDSEERRIAHDDLYRVPVHFHALWFSSRPLDTRMLATEWIVLAGSRYQRVFALDLEHTTPNALETAIGEYGASGTTRDRAVRFFIKAAEHAGVKMSTRLTKGLRSRSSSPTSSTNGNGDDEITTNTASDSNASRKGKKRHIRAQGRFQKTQSPPPSPSPRRRG